MDAEKPTKVNFRLKPVQLEVVDSFAAEHGMSRAAASEFFILRGIEAHADKTIQRELFTALFQRLVMLLSVHEKEFDAARVAQARDRAESIINEILGD